jgi:small subunit ribosomal protein S20
MQVFVALEDLKKKKEPSQDMIAPVETLISEAFSRIDKAVKVGTIHKNTGARRKSRLSRAKKTLEAQLGWYTPAEPSSAIA